MLNALYGSQQPPRWSASQRAVDAVEHERQRNGGVVVLEGRRGAGRTSILRTLYLNFRDTARYIRVEQWSRSQPFALFERIAEMTAPKIDRTVFTETTEDDHRAAEHIGHQHIEVCREILEHWKTCDNIVILVDDVHQADEHSQKLLSYLANRIDNTGVILVLSVPEQISTLHPELEGLLHNPVSTRIIVTPLEPSAIQHLAHTMGFHSLDKVALTALAEHTGGWLDYVIQTLAALPDGKWPVEPGNLPLPRRIVAEVMQPFTRTKNANVWKLVCALAVIEQQPGLHTLANIADVDDLLKAIDEAVLIGVLQNGVLREAFNTSQLQLEFAHPMAARVIVRQMLPTEHRTYHLRAAAHLESHGERLLHKAAATLKRDPVLGGEIIRFAERLGRTGRWEQSARFRFAAARLMSSETQRRSEVLNGVDALTSAGSVTTAAPWIPTIEAMPSSAAREAVLGHLALHQGRAADAGHLLSEAEYATAQGDIKAVIALRKCLDMLCRWDAQGIIEWADRAASLSKPGEASEVEALAIRGVGLAAQGHTDSADQALHDAFEEGGEGPQHQRFRLCAGWVGLLEGDFRTAYRELETALHTEARGGALRISLWAQAWLARIQFLLGDWDSALHGALDGIRRAEQSGIEIMLPLLEWTAREIQVWRDETPAETTWSFTNISQLRGYNSMQVPARMIKAAECKVNNDQEGALAALMPLLESDPWNEQQASFWHWQPELIHALITANRIEEAAQVSKDFTKHTTKAARYVRASATAAAARVAAAQKDIDRAEELFTEALRMTSQDGVATYHGRYLFAYSQMLRRAGRRRDAAQRLVSAREFFTSVQATVMVERCNRELRATGMLQHRTPETSVVQIETQPPATVLPDQLTPQEHAIAQLVVQGLTNRETARNLFIAEKTVQYHLTRIYSKYGIRSRTELTLVYAPEHPTPAGPDAEELGGETS